MKWLTLDRSGVAAANNWQVNPIGLGYVLGFLIRRDRIFWWSLSWLTFDRSGVTAADGRWQVNPTRLGSDLGFFIRSDHCHNFVNWQVKWEFSNDLKSRKLRQGR